VSTQIRSEHPISGRDVWEDMLPVITAAGEAVEQEQWIALAVVSIEDLEPVQLGGV